MTHEPHRYRAGEAIQDLCRACKAPREHTVVAADETGRVLRVMCGFCGSQHNYRGGGDETPARSGHRAAVGPRLTEAPFDLVTERERTSAPMSDDASRQDLELLLRRIIREETGLTPV
ncbi:MAG: hypothetical protein MUF51_07395, partial [Vicinamibacteria bacterium]|nr:hypothetical protein [Vicinamibacteria bacterium]